MFYETTVDSWNNARSLFDELAENYGWVFRGQSDPTWDLETKFTRQAEAHQCNDPYWFRNREKCILKDFQRGAHNYVQNLPEFENYIEWLSLLQHHGGATRLLDFSYSSYIALFFALQVPNHNSASVLWAVNTRKLNECVKGYQYYTESIKPQSYDDVLNNNNLWANEIIKNRKADDVVLLVEPFLQHDRIFKQQGLFLFPGNIEKPFARVATQNPPLMAT